MPTVFITNKSPHDFTPAERFGKIVYLSKGMFDPYSIGRMYRLFSEGLKYSEKTDYILLTGLTVMNTVASVVFSLKHHRLNLLLYDLERNRYVAKTLVFEELEVG
jgi:hypothetical protein